MGWLVVALVAALVYQGYKAYVHTQQTTLLVGLLETLALILADKGEDYERALWRIYGASAETTPIHEFNKQWEGLCRVAGVRVRYEDAGGIQCVAPTVIEPLARALYMHPRNQELIQWVEAKRPRSLSLKELRKRGLQDSLTTDNSIYRT